MRRLPKGRHAVTSQSHDTADYLLTDFLSIDSGPYPVRSKILKGLVCLQGAFDWALGWVSEATFEGFARMHIHEAAQQDPPRLPAAAAQLRKRCGNPRQASPAMQV